MGSESLNQMIQEIKDLEGAPQAVIVFKRDSFTSQDLRNSLSGMKTFVNDISKRAESKRSFNNFNGDVELPSDVTLLNGISEQAIISELRSLEFTEGTTKVIVINTNALSVRGLDRVIKKIDSPLSGIKYFNVFVGTNKPVALTLLQKKQGGVKAETAWLTSTLLNAILISLTLVISLWCAFSQALSIKTPTIFVEKSIDFGKIEK